VRAYVNEKIMHPRIREGAIGCGRVTCKYNCRERSTSKRGITKKTRKKIGEPVGRNMNRKTSLCTIYFGKVISHFQ